MLLVALVFAPFLFPGTRSLAAASRICIFIVLAASYDILLGYTGIVSFAHTMFFGIGAYAVAIPLARGWVGWDAVLAGALVGVVLSAVLAALIGLLSLRVRAIFFSMITLAVASFAQLLATQLRDLTGGEDGLTFSVPARARPRLPPVAATRCSGVRINGTVLTYYLVLARRARAVPAHAADRELALRPGAAGDPGERVPGRGAGLSRRRLSHASPPPSRPRSPRSPAR